MDDRAAYLLNGLWSRYYDLGRIIRFRQVQRGRQATCYELLTSEQNEYLVSLYPATFDLNHFDAIAAAALLLHREHFPIAEIVAAKDHQPAVTGPQGSVMMVTANVVGQYLLPDEWSLHDLSQLGLRLGWMHRLMHDHFAPPPELPVLGQDLTAALGDNPAHVKKKLPPLEVEHLFNLRSALAELPPAGWAHGDFQPAAVMMDEDRQIRAITDLALLHFGDPLEDLLDAFVHWCVGSDGIVAEQRGRSLVESYRSLRPTAETLATERPWAQVVQRWCGQRIVDAAAGRRTLPRGFATYLADPSGLASAVELCETK